MDQQHEIQRLRERIGRLEAQLQKQMAVNQEIRKRFETIKKAIQADREDIDTLKDMFGLA